MPNVDWAGAIRAVDWGAVFPVVTLLLGVAVTAAFEESRSRAADRRSQAARVEARLYDQRMHRIADTRTMLLAMTQDAVAGKPRTLSTDEHHPNASIRLLGDIELSVEYASIILVAVRGLPVDKAAWQRRILTFRDRALRALVAQEERVAKGQEPTMAPLQVSEAEARKAASQDLGQVAI